MSIGWRSAILLAALFPLTPATTTTELDTRLGRIRGKLESSSTGRPYHAFYSIPYAKPPIGERRFRPPEASAPWPAGETLDATTEGPPCLQIPPLTEDGVVGDEDCLWLSVFVPQREVEEWEEEEEEEEKKMPVLFWIHGGRALVGSARTAAYSPEYVMDEGDIIMVSIQYRLGALGFLTTEDSAAPGNYASKDQQAALRWVRDNVGDFGGDPGAVTVVGHSFGGVSAHGHVFSPGSRGLFRGVVSLSGTANMAWASRTTGTPGRDVARLQASLVGCPDDDDATSQQMVDCLRKVDAGELTRSQADLHAFLRRSPGKLPLSTYMTRVDAEAEEPFWPKDPRIALREGDYAFDVPWMNGVTSMEGTWYAVALLGEKPGTRWDAEEDVKVFNANRAEAMRTLALYDVFTDNTAIYPFYFGDRDLTTSEEDKVAFSKMVSDLLFNYDSFHGAYLHSRVEGAAPVYQYRFDYRGNWSFTHLFDDPETDYGGVGHLDDIRFFLTMGYTPEKTDEELEAARAHTGRIAHFVREGGFHESVWPAYGPGPGRGAYLVVGEDSGRQRVERRPPFQADRMRFWARMNAVEEDILEDFMSAEEEEEGRGADGGRVEL